MKLLFWKKNNERGAVLIAGLMILLILSLIGVTAMQNTTLEERMANNFAQRDLAFQSAESALRDAEAFLGGMSITTLQALNFTATGTNGLFAPADADDVPVWGSVDWFDDDETIVYSATALEAVAAQPRYIVERLLPDRCEPPIDENLPKCQMVFRVTARGVGANLSSIVLVQSTYLSAVF